MHEGGGPGGAPCTPGPPIPAPSNALRLPPHVQRCLLGVLQDAWTPPSPCVVPPPRPLGCRGLTWKMARPGLGGGRRGVMARLFSLDSHSWMVTILRAGGGRCRWVRRAFFRWWKSPSVSVYLPGTPGQEGRPRTPAPPPAPQPRASPPPLLLGLLALVEERSLVEGDAAGGGGAGGEEPLALRIPVAGGRQAVGVLHFDGDICGEGEGSASRVTPMARAGFPS